MFAHTAARLNMTEAAFHLPFKMEQKQIALESEIKNRTLFFPLVRMHRLRRIDEQRRKT